MTSPVGPLVQRAPRGDPLEPKWVGIIPRAFCFLQFDDKKRWVWEVSSQAGSGSSPIATPFMNMARTSCGMQTYLL